HKLAIEKSVELVEHGPSAPVIIRGDSEALRRLAFILLENAIKYTSERGRVDVHCRLQGDQAELQVVDTGSGIAPTDQQHIFDRFWRADKVRSRDMGGAGLGLSIARWIVEQHHGTIEVRSTPGAGSTFTVRIPTLPRS